MYLPVPTLRFEGNLALESVRQSHIAGLSPLSIDLLNALLTEYLRDSLSIEMRLRTTAVGLYIVMPSGKQRDIRMQNSVSSTVSARP